MHAVDRVERRVLEICLEVLPVGDQVDVHGLDVAPVDQAQVRVTGSRDHVPLPAAAVLHQADHLIRRSGGVLVDLAAGRLGERVDPRFVGVAVPQDQVQLTLAGADGGLRLHVRRRRLLRRGFGSAATRTACYEQ